VLSISTVDSLFGISISIFTPIPSIQVGIWWMAWRKGVDDNDGRR